MNWVSPVAAPVPVDGGGLVMILANVRSRLRAADFRLVVLALGGQDAARRARYEQMLAEEGPDKLLDDPALLTALLSVRSLAVPSAALFAYVAVRHTLLAGGTDDRALADYDESIRLKPKSAAVVAVLWYGYENMFVPEAEPAPAAFSECWKEGSWEPTTM